jgi:hypothetical protein
VGAAIAKLANRSARTDFILMVERRAFPFDLRRLLDGG